MGMTEQRPLAGRVALVTGVSRKAGIGFGIAKRLAQKGAHLFLHGFASYDVMQPYGADDSGMAGIAEELREFGVKVGYVSADFSDPDAPERVVGAAQVEYGNVDILIVNHAHGYPGVLESLTPETLDAHLIVNVRATLLLVKAYAGQYTGSYGGRVILLTSGQHRNPMVGEIAYVASKGALHQVTGSLAAYLAPRNITVNTVDPGATDTGYADPRTVEAVLRQQPMGRWGAPDDAARLIAWLATDDATWITGQVITSNGGGA